MYENFKSEILRLLLLSFGILLFGLLTGQWLFVVLVGLGGYLLWQLRQFYLLERWMMGVQTPVDELSGTLQYVAQNLEKHRKQGRKRKRRITRLLQRFNRTLEVLPDAIIVLNKKYRIEWLNAAAMHLLGVSRKDGGKFIYDAVSIYKFEKYLSKGDFESPLECVSPTNPGIELELNITPFGEGQYLLTAHDISEIKKVESVRREFIANVSHELRTPLTVISGYMEMLTSEEDDLPPYVNEALHSSSRQTERMKTLVSDLLLLSRLELNDDVPVISETVNVPLMLDGLVKDTVRLSDQRQHVIRLEADKNLLFKGNEAELSSAFGNLMFNAVLHTPPGTEIIIRWLKTEDRVLLQVEDKGRGIEPQHLARLTERFYRVDKARSRERGGTGLGLSISKHVVQHHEGEIQVSSVVGSGTTFTCSFPIELAVDKTSADSSQEN